MPTGKGSSPQVKGAINSTLSWTKAATYTAIRSVLPPGIPNNEGVFRAITVSAPPGTITNAVLPAACAARGLTGFRMVDCAFGALAMMLPDKVFAASDGGNTGITIGGYDDERKPFVYVDFTCGTWGARPWADGLDGNSNIFANMASQSVEVTEAEYPLQILSYEFVADRAGAGRYRGGTPFRRDYRFLETEGLLQVRSDRRDFRPYGLYGGSPGQPSRNAMNPGPGERPLPSKLTETILEGDVFRHELAGAGGWGDPLERDPQAVLRDLRNELIGEARARDDYGVIVDRARWRVDEAGDRGAPGRVARRARVGRAARGLARRDARAGGKRAREQGVSGWRIGVDIGGTFTDIVLLAEDGTVATRKVSSSVDDYARAIMEGVASLVAEHAVDGADIAEVVHGTTVASNALLERKGARTGLIGTQGFRDVLEIRNLRMPRLYDLAWEKPPPLVERYLRAVVDERIDAAGRVQKALDAEDARAAVDRLLAEGVDAIAICLINAFANPAHERALEAIVRARAPGCTVCTSYDVLPEIKEYERTSTTVINTYISPIVRTYLERLGEAIGERCPGAHLLIMQSNGGLTSAEEASRRPVNIVESGPAGGVVGALAMAGDIGQDDLVTFDMGGTTAKAALIEGGVISRSAEFQVGGGILTGSRLMTGAGYLVRMPAIDLAEVGAGGGSLIAIDAGGSMQVGPESAGAEPGPVCYDQGRQRAHHHRRQRGTRLPQPGLSRGRCAPHRFRQGHRRDEAPGRRPPRRLGGGSRVWRAPHRRLQHDPGDPRGLHRARPRPARLHAGGLRRQRPGVRRGDGAGARHPPRGRAARARPLLLLRAAHGGRRAPHLAHLPRAAAGPRQGRAQRGVGRAGRRRAPPARSRRLRRTRRHRRAPREPPLPGPDLRAHRRRAGRPARRCRARGAGRGLRRRARAHLRPPRRAGGAGGAGDASRAGPRPPPCRAAAPN